MLKRSRAPSPSPSRADPSSPPPLDDNPRLPFPKRRRIAGPVIDSVERRAGAAEDDGEDDDDFEYEYDGTNLLPPDAKYYRESQACSSPMSIQHHVLPPEVEETISGCSNPVHSIAEGLRNKPEQGEDERMRVTQRYEDTNRLLGSLVLSRRRTLRSPSVDAE
ncbi:hypothetical protein JB92DRAFT_3092904 [Gautieria morchelliformis]|nr:hypothetical protein JB92DRAFT_3092904 [Gautieria morchelliformis]